MGWAFGLVADEPAVRAAAPARLAEGRARFGEAARRFNAALLETRSDYRNPAVREAFARRVATGRFLPPDALWNRPPGDIRSWAGLPSSRARTDAPRARRHAGYALRLLDHPELPNTRHVRRTWTAAHGAGGGGERGPGREPA
ncbi:hypothetical protein D7319_00290 [Streptomyces radicis]|uniref:Uncharacterized protein n=1 Tax=Streptomyces radicis TaxID=1750517 RepID=A0A3A9WJ92_9ACTN|nr:hypothetical protein D7319_00290 [Streptomyces radicis]RKN27888.1 hypothetical protein D7318_02600 [Streptomyces radicis]